MNIRLKRPTRTISGVCSLLLLLSLSAARAHGGPVTLVYFTVPGTATTVTVTGQVIAGNGVPVTAPIPDGTPVSVAIDATLGGTIAPNIDVDFGMETLAAGLVGNPAEGDYVSWALRLAYGPHALTALNPSDSWTLSYTSTGFSDGDGDSWTFTMPNNTILGDVFYNSGSAQHFTYSPSFSLYDAPLPEPSSVVLLGCGCASALLYGVVTVAKLRREKRYDRTCVKIA